MSDNDRNEAREAAARAFTGLCCVTVADEVCEDCVGALLYLASMHEAIEYLHLRDFAQQNTIRNLRRRPSRHEAHEDVVERMRVTARDLLHDMETTDVTIAIQEREEARDQTRGLLAALEQAQEERDRFRKVLTKIGDNYGADPVWLARVVLERWHFAEYDSAPEWFQEAALAATEEGSDAE